jgi:hypothetical protein
MAHLGWSGNFCYHVGSQVALHMLNSRLVVGMVYQKARLARPLRTL